MRRDFAKTRCDALARPGPVALACAVLLAALAACSSPPRDADIYPPGYEGPSLPPPEEDTDERGWTKGQKAIALNAGTTAIITAYGLQFWDYGGASFQVIDEGWFGPRTDFGGADKLGHAYATYLATLGFSAVYEAWGFERERADLLGAVSSMGTFTLVEVGDALSKNGFSFEDLGADAAGVLFGYLRRRHPEVGRYVDFRVEYVPSEAVTKGGRTDIATDYSGFKYLLAFKLNAFEKVRSTPFEYLEIHAGYYTRGFLNADRPYFDEKTRHLYLGVGLNLSHILNKLDRPRAGNVFNFYQAPYTYLPVNFAVH